jgi:hypothetical protein
MTLPRIAAFVSLLCLLCPAGLAVDLDTDPQLAGWWKFNDASGTTATDSSKHGRNGKLAGGPSFAENALSFDGEDDLVQIAGYQGIEGTSPRTLSVWVKTDNPAGEIVSWGHKDFGRMWILCFIRKHMGVTPEGGYYYMAASIHDNEWHHVVAVVQEADLPNLHDDVTLYLDGTTAEIDNIGMLDLWPIETEADQDVTIGQGFKGAIDELRIYERELTEEEVAALYKLGR